MRYGCLHDPANVQQTFSKCIQNTSANDGRLLDRVNTLLQSTTDDRKTTHRAKDKTYNSWPKTDMHYT